MTDRLAAPEATVRRNALEVLAEALARGAAAPASSSSSSPSPSAPLSAAGGGAGLRQLLADRVLPCLSDADLSVRKAAAALLGASLTAALARSKAYVRAESIGMG